MYNLLRSDTKQEAPHHSGAEHHVIQYRIDKSFSDAFDVHQK